VSIERYMPDYRQEEMYEFSFGQWVKHTDYAALAERCERLEAEMRRFLVVIEGAEGDSETWDRLTYGTGIATANAYRAALSPSSGGGDE